jgi:hypothetical protein
MTPILETLSWIAAIIAVPIAVIGWFASGARRTNKSVASNGGTAISGDMHVEGAGVVAAHNSHVKVSLAVSKDTQNADRFTQFFKMWAKHSTRPCAIK